MRPRAYFRYVIKKSAKIRDFAYSNLSLESQFYRMLVIDELS